MYDLNPPGHCGPHLPSAGVNQPGPFEVNEEKLALHQLRIWPHVTVLFQESTDIPEKQQSI